MAFTSYTPGVFRSGTHLEEGTCSINSSGETRLLAADLALVKIGDSAHALFDEDGGKVAIRRPRDAEPGLVVRPAGTKKKPSTVVSIVGLRGPIQKCGFKPNEVAGKYELITKDDLLIIVLRKSAAAKSPATATAAKRK